MYIIVRHHDIILMHLDDQYIFNYEQIISLLDIQFDVSSTLIDAKSISKKIISFYEKSGTLYSIIHIHFIDDETKFHNFNDDIFKKICNLAKPYTREIQIDKLLK